MDNILLYTSYSHSKRKNEKERINQTNNSFSHSSNFQMRSSEFEFPENINKTKVSMRVDGDSQ